jgi:hypothetical protein
MSLAIGFLVVFLLAVPGIVFRVTYLSSPYSRRNINTTTLEEIYSSLIPAFIFHSFSVVLLHFIGHEIDYQFLFNLLIGSNTAKNLNKLNQYLPPFLIYMFINIVLNFLAAFSLRRLVLRHKLYKRFDVLSIYNKWYDILKPKTSGQEEISVWLDVVLETKNDTLIYRGFLTDFWLDKDGGIKELHMEDVRRRVLSRDETNEPADQGVQTSNQPSDTSFESDMTEAIDERYYHIPGERFIIKYQDVRNMNITYYAEETM